MSIGESKLEEGSEKDQESLETGDFSVEEYEYMHDHPLNRIGMSPSHERLNKIVDKVAVRALVEEYKEADLKDNFKEMNRIGKEIGKIMSAL